MANGSSWHDTRSLWWPLTQFQFHWTTNNKLQTNKIIHIPSKEDKTWENVLRADAELRSEVCIFNLVTCYVLTTMWRYEQDSSVYLPLLWNTFPFYYIAIAMAHVIIIVECWTNNQIPPANQAMEYKLILRLMDLPQASHRTAIILTSAQFNLPDNNCNNIRRTLVNKN